MPKGWTIEIAIEDHRGDTTVCLQSFDVAIEDQAAAEEVVRQRAGKNAVIHISQERSKLSGLSPGRELRSFFRAHGSRLRLELQGST